MFSCIRRFWANSIPHFDECGLEAEPAGGRLGDWESGESREQRAESKRRERHRLGVMGGRSAGHKIRD
jgi:hypothetical protein